MNTSKDKILFLLSFIQDRLSSSKYVALNENSQIVIGQIAGRIYYVESLLKSYPLGTIRIDDSVKTVESMQRAWNLFDKNFDGNISSVSKLSYDILIKDTVALVEYIIASIDRKEEPSTKVVDLKELDKKLSLLSDARDRTKSQIEKLTGQVPKNEEAIRDLRDKMVKLDADYISVLDAKRKISSDSAVEKSIAEKVTSAFNDLQKYTKVIEDERYRAKIEFYLFLYSIPFVIVAFAVLYCCFIIEFTSNRDKFILWKDFIPYTASIPFVVALIWLCVYLKNRASKISIELSTRLFNIHYLEGLMQLTNSLSVTPEEAIRKLDNATNLLMDNYLLQIKENHITTRDIDHFEVSELKSNPYWKILQEIKNLIKLIKQ